MNFIGVGRCGRIKVGFIEEVEVKLGGIGDGVVEREGIICLFVFGMSERGFLYDFCDLGVCGVILLRLGI